MYVMTKIAEYKEHYILYDAHKTPSGLWEASATITDDDVEKTAKNLRIYNTFSAQEVALGYAITYGQKAIDTIISDEKPTQDTQ